MTEENYFKHESSQDTKSIVKYLNALAEGIEKGHVVLSNNNKEIELNPNGLLHLYVKAKGKNGKSNLDIHLFWQEQP